MCCLFFLSVTGCILKAYILKNKMMYWIVSGKSIVCYVKKFLCDERRVVISRTRLYVFVMMLYRGVGNSCFSRQLFDFRIFLLLLQMKDRLLGSSNFAAFQ